MYRNRTLLNRVVKPTQKELFEPEEGYTLQTVLPGSCTEAERA